MSLGLCILLVTENMYYSVEEKLFILPLMSHYNVKLMLVMLEKV